MPKDEKAESLADNAVKLKKAGFPIVVSVIVALAGAPGAWEFFFNRTDEVAAVKVEMAYQLLKAQTERIEGQLVAERDETKELRRLLTQLLLQRAGGMGTVRLPEPTPALPKAEPLPDNLDALVNQELAE